VTDLPVAVGESFAGGRTLLWIVAASYPLSAALLLWMKQRGEDVPWIWPLAWLVTGVIGLVSTSVLRDNGGLWWWVALLALVPMMIVSTVVDVRHGYWIIVAVDVAGLIALALGFWWTR
jgi:hypothetical protein